METERFLIRRTLGAGGMGIVYEAEDRQHGTSVALKALKNLGPASLYRFKREFRALSDLNHDNLVSLYELFSVGSEWFFTMELVDGTSFLQHVRGDDFVARDTDIDETEPTGPLDTEAPARPIAIATLPDLNKLTAALEQLARGLATLHGAGHLHRDIKPSNVLVTSAGRVVICDFGLVTESDAGGTHGSRQHVVGTAPYMSPEQAAALPLTEASDWYSVGVMLHQALTGELPFKGASRRVLMEKQMHEPPPPSLSVPGVPKALDELCSALLKIDPTKRAGAQAVLAALGAEPGPASVRAAESAPFVGRSAELSELDSALAAAEHAPVVALVHGPSGIGKSTLVRTFLDRVANDGGTLALSARCYERESVPFKALDSLIDALTNELRKLPRAQVERVIGPDIQALTRMFPVLRRVSAIAEAPPRGFEVPDPQESRRRAAAALRELVRRLSAELRLIVHLDDAHWGDADSGPLLSELFRPPDAPRVLLIVSYRSEQARESGLIAALERAPDVRAIALGALSDGEAEALAASLVLPGVSAADVASESRGNPMFVHELARWLETKSAQAPVSVDHMIAARVRELPKAAYALLGAVAIAGRPLPLDVLGQAADLDSGEYSALSLLRAEKLVRSRRSGAGEQVEAFHDRVREAVVQSLEPDERRRYHARLVAALEARGDADPEALLEHLLGAEQHQRAGEQAEHSADQAAAGLAFDRAAHLYRLALTLAERSPAERSRVLSKLGDSLVNAGLGRDAAVAYRNALTGASIAHALELRRRIAEQLLRSGHLDEGLDAVRELLALVGLELAPTPRRALASLVLGRARIRLRGLGFRQRDASEIAPADLTRIDVCWSIATALGITDFIRGAEFQTRHLLLALEAGEPERVARGLAVETAYSGGAGGSERRRTEHLVKATRELAARLDSPHLDGLVTTVDGIAAFLQGRWLEARHACERGEQIFRERCTGVAWELASAQFFGLGALYYLGDFQELARRVPERLREAEERGDLYRATGLRSWRTNAHWLALGDPEQARAQVEIAIRQWTRRGFHLQHYYEMFSLCQIDLYTGKDEAALARLDDRFPELERSLLLRIQNVRVEALYLRARAILAVALARGGDRALLARADSDARRIRRERMAWSNPYASVIEAAVRAQSGEHERAARLLERAIAEFSQAQMALFAESARHALARLRGDEPSRERAETWMRAHGIEQPARMARMQVAAIVGP